MKRMVSSREVSWWLYLMIGGSVVLTVLLTSKVLDKMARPIHLRVPPIRAERDYTEMMVQDLDLAAQKNVKHPPPPPSQRVLDNQTASSPISIPEVWGGRKSSKQLIEHAVKDERELLAKEMEGYRSPSGASLSSLMSEKGGQPLRAMVVTTWRSGSTFLGDIMNAHPATFYHYEPLLHYDIKQARSGALAADAVRTLTDLMHCNYSSIDSYLKYGKSHPWLFKHNERLWKNCVEGGRDKYRSSYCWKPEFLNRYCPLFPFQSIKTVRLRLNLTKTLVEDPSLNVRVLLLIRDPRGTMQSRKHRDWCPNNPDCEDPARLCSDLVDDYHSFKRLQVTHPTKYKVFRYEDFSMNPVNNTADVFQFYGFSVHQKVTDFLESHTKANKGGVSSTFRDSKTAPFKWREQLNMTEVVSIQDKCSEAMRLWGYRRVNSSDQLRTFQPVIDLENFELKY